MQVSRLMTSHLEVYFFVCTLHNNVAWSTIPVDTISDMDAGLLFHYCSIFGPYSSKPMYTSGGDSRVIYAPGVVPSSSSYDAATAGGGSGSANAGGGGADDSAAGGAYRVNAKPNPMGQHSTAGSAGGGGGGGVEGGDAAQGGGGMYHADGGAADEGGAL